MCRLPVFWLPLVLAVLITNQCAVALPTISQLREILTSILFEDELYDDVLSERVILDRTTDNLPPRVDEVVNDLNNVDPLVSLHALLPRRQYYSLDNLELSRTIVVKSLSCLMNKRMAFHLALMIGLIQNPENESHFPMRVRMFTYAISFYINMLSSISKNYESLLKVHDTVNNMLSSPNPLENAVEKLKEQLTLMNDVIKSSCVVHDVQQYCSLLNLKELNNCKEQITDENIISKDLDVNIFIATLKENENAILNSYDEMDVLRSVDMDALNVWLLTPDLPPVTDTTAFIRTPLPKFRDVVEKIIYAREDAVERETELEIEIEEEETSTTDHS